MENTKLFKAKISENLYNDVINHFNKLHNEQQKIENINTTAKQKDKIHKSVMIVGGTVGLLTIGMAISNNFELYKINQDLMTFSALSSLVIGAVSQKIHKSVELLREDYRKRLTSPMTYMKDFYQFEEKLVAALNKAGFPVYLQGVTDYQDFREMRDLWKTSKDLDADLRSKTTEYVKHMMEEYDKPEATKPIKLKPY